MLGSLVSKGQSKSGTMSKYYSLKVSYLQTDEQGMDFFSVSSSGSTLSEFRSNAKAFILKKLIYEGFVRKDALVDPIADHLDLQQQFKENEAKYLTPLIRKVDLVKEVAFDKGRKHDDEKLYRPVITLMVNRALLELEVKRLLN